MKDQNTIFTAYIIKRNEIYKNVCNHENVYYLLHVQCNDLK